MLSREEIRDILEEPDLSDEGVDEVRRECETLAHFILRFLEHSINSHTHDVDTPKNNI